MQADIEYTSYSSISLLMRLLLKWIRVCRRRAYLKIVKITCLPGIVTIKSIYKCPHSRSPYTHFGNKKKHIRSTRDQRGGLPRGIWFSFLQIVHFQSVRVFNQCVYIEHNAALTTWWCSGCLPSKLPRKLCGTTHIQTPTLWTPSYALSLFIKFIDF